MATYRIAVLPGDGIGAEVTPEAIRVLEAVGKGTGTAFEFELGLVGGAAIDATGKPLAPGTLELCRAAHAILFGAVGGPKWDDVPHEQRPERGLLAIRKELDLYANLRPAKCFPMLVDASPLKRQVVEGTDLMVIRELTGGLYFGEPRGVERFADGGARAINTMAYTAREVERLARIGCDVARNRRQGHREPDRRDPLGGDAVAVLAQHGEGRRPDRARGAAGARAGSPDGGHRGAGRPADRYAGDGRLDRARRGATVLMASGL